MSTILFENAVVLDVEAGEIKPKQQVVVVDDQITEVGSTVSTKASDADQVIDVKGKTLMPGLIDGHVHIYLQSFDKPDLMTWSQPYLTLKAAKCLNETLQRDFTTVRDTSGADYDIANAVDEGVIPGPRIIPWW